MIISDPIYRNSADNTKYYRLRWFRGIKLLSTKMWVAEPDFDWPVSHIGPFKSEIEAAEAYSTAWEQWAEQQQKKKEKEMIRSMGRKKAKQLRKQLAAEPLLLPPIDIANCSVKWKMDVKDHKKIEVADPDLTPR